MRGSYWLSVSGVTNFNSGTRVVYKGEERWLVGQLKGIELLLTMLLSRLMVMLL